MADRTIAKILESIDYGVQPSQSDIDAITEECERLSDEIVSGNRERAIRAYRTVPRLLGALLDENARQEAMCIQTAAEAELQVRRLRGNRDALTKLMKDLDTVMAGHGHVVYGPPGRG